MDRENELRLPAETPWLNDPKVTRVCTAIEAGGYDIFFVGGCVRNVVLDEVAVTLICPQTPVLKQ